MDIEEIKDRLFNLNDEAVAGKIAVMAMIRVCQLRETDETRMEHVLRGGGLPGEVKSIMTFRLIYNNKEEEEE